MRRFDREPLEAIYDRLINRKASKRQLDDHGYPRLTDISGVAEFKKDKAPYNESERKICRRCSQSFILRNSERPEGGKCTYHYGRCFDDIWRCCSQRRSARGCMEAETHVHDDNLNNREGYVTTQGKTTDACPGVFAVDCEMSYTVDGLELTRVSIVDHNCRTVYDKYVKPYGEILSYNTEHSGVTKSHLEGVSTTLADVQNFMLENFSENTILIGHSLESDFVALRLIHETVVDTSLIFTHPKGLPYKFALRTLAKKRLGKIVQSGGHDSVEDAVTCMRLMLRTIGINK